MSPIYVLTISFEMVRKKLPYPLWRWDRFAYEEGLMAPLDVNGSFIPGNNSSYIHLFPFQTIRLAKCFVLVVWDQQTACV